MIEPAELGVHRLALIRPDARTGVVYGNLELVAAAPAANEHAAALGISQRVG
jgi:hypothetical protein